jgi:lysophospholipase L1-like esterase
MGDSITFGQHIDPALRWTTLIAQRLAGSLSARAFVSYNRGISGDTTRMGLERFPADVQQLRPHVMTLQFGLNDCNCWESDCGLPRVSSRAFEANLIEMIERARHFGTRAIILSTNHPTVRRTLLPSGERYEDANRRYSEIVRRVADATGVVLCDIRARFEELTDQPLADLMLPYPDQLHLSPAGNAVYADAIWPYVRAEVEALTNTKVGG